MSCFLRAYGARFDVDRFLEKSKLRPSNVWRKGDARLDGRDGSVASSGLAVEISEDDWDDIDLQIRRAMRFLKRHAAEIRRLSSTSEVETAVIDFGVRRKSEELMQGAFFPRPLIEDAGRAGVGIRVATYAFSRRQNASGRRRNRARARRAVP